MKGGSGHILEDVEQATEIVHSWNNPGTNAEAVLPKEVLQHCHGLVFVHFLKVSAVVSGSSGSGFVVAKLKKGTPEEHWSAPSALHTSAVGVGIQLGAEKVHNVLALNSADALEKFYEGAKLKLGTDLTCSAGPVGARLEKMEMTSAPKIYAYSYSKGASIGASVEGTVLDAHKKSNDKFYGEEITAKELLTGSEADVGSKHTAIATFYEELNKYMVV
mmetsp:Transcript_14111/g.35986  ORF Transcript_14111/g.35986 Transcript_14111/m.35986 type:complete len:218 (-) Transcript_14111:154-807(-)